MASVAMSAGTGAASPTSSAASSREDAWPEQIYRQDVSIDIGSQKPLNDTATSLIVSWVIFVQRGSLGLVDEDPNISWRFSSQGKLHTLLPQQYAHFADKNVEDLAAYIRSQDDMRSLAVSEHNGLSLDLEAKACLTEISSEAILRCSVTFDHQKVTLTSQSHSPEMSSAIVRTHLQTIADIYVELERKRTSSLFPSHFRHASESELQQVWQWNDPLPSPIEKCAHEYFTHYAGSQPRKPAVVSWDGTFTYAEVDSMSNNLAAELQRTGVACGTVVPLIFEKSAWTVIAVLAVMKAGGTFVMTDPSQPETRLKSIVAEVSAKTILTSERYIELGQRVSTDAHIISVGTSTRLKLEESNSVDLAAVPADVLMYIIFTSGSTGKPKGVMISHSSYTTGAIPRAEIVGYNPSTRVLDFASYAFDVSIDCMILTLATGGCICVPSEDDRVNNLSGAIRKMSVNMVHTTPSIARVLDADVIPGLQVLGLGGEAVPARDAHTWNEQTNGGVVIAYGPSECTVGCTFRKFDEERRGKSYTSLGKGCGGCLWIVDAENHDILSPVGAIGELLVEGAIVGDGYINEPEKTAAAFIETPEWLKAGSKQHPGRRGRLYKTGDLVRYDPDGSGAVVFSGRKDQQIKIRGQRVELEEVEHHLRVRLPEKTAVAAEVVVPVGNGEPVLVAFVVEPGDNVQRDRPKSAVYSQPFQELLTALQEKLFLEIPKYMVPTAFVPVEQIPTTVSGKTDHKQLKAIGSQMTRKQLAAWKQSQCSPSEYRPLTSKEASLARLWNSVLSDSSDMAADDNFFVLGGDSLRAMRLVSVARKNGLTLSIRGIFAHPTLSTMAEEATEAMEQSATHIPCFSLLDKSLQLDLVRAEAAKACDVDVDLIEDIYPCTPLQEGLMALSAKVPEAYVAQRVLQMQDGDAADKLQAAFTAAAVECPILRTRIVHTPSLGLAQVTIAGPPEWHVRSDLKDYLVEDREQGMELGMPLCRFATVHDKVADAPHFVLTMHHALYDGWSMPLVVDRVNRQYAGVQKADRTSFKAFVKYLQDMDAEVSKSYWKELLSGAEPRQCPSLPSTEYQTKADSLLEQYVHVPTSERSASTMATLIRGAWALTASQYTSSPDVVFGETLTGRNADVPGIEEIEGPLITTVPMRVRLARDMKASEYLTYVHQQTIERMPHEHFGLQNIRLLSSDARRACDLRTGFVLHPCAEDDDAQKIQEGPAMGLVPAGDSEAAQEALKFNSYALMMVCTLEKSGFLTMASFDSNTISTEEMQALLDAFSKAVSILSTCPGKTLQEVWDVPHGEVVLDSKPSQKEADLRKSASQQLLGSVEKTKSLSAAEQLLCNTWARVLKVDQTEIDDETNFFDLGGDSICAMKLVSELRQAGFTLTVAKVFANRRLREMASLLKAISPRNSGTVEGSSIAASIGAEDPNAAQIKQYLADPTWEVLRTYKVRPLQDIAVQGTTEVPRYSVRYELFHFSSAIDKDRLSRCCKQLVADLEILRTVFVRHNDKCLGVVLEAVDDVFESRATHDDPAVVAHTLSESDIQKDMPLGSNFVKFTLIEGSDGKSCLAFRLSHAQYDEICLPLMLQRLSSLYQNLHVPDVAPFSSFVRHVEEDSLPKAKQYWRDVLKGSAMTRLPGPEIELQDRKQLISLTKDVDLSSRPSSITIASLPTAAWALCLSRRLSSADIVFGEVVSGRNTGFESSNAVIGPCWQYITTRIRFQEGWTGLDLLQAVQDQHIASSEFESMGLAEIVEHCTDWPATTDWFDSVLHQDVAHVENLEFNMANCTLETFYPHIEPLREWKIQAFAGKDSMTLEVVTFKEWSEFGEGLLADLVAAFEQLVSRSESIIKI